MKKHLRFGVLLFLFLTTSLFSGTAGKIVGIVKDAKSGEPLPGANILLEGTVMGASSDVDGYYVILNVPPGVYTLRGSMIGYTDRVVTVVRVNIDLTTSIDFEMASTVVEAGEVTVVAHRPVVQKDIAATTVNIDAGEIAALPVQSVTEVVGLQAGIQGLSIRGSDSNELAFMVDGFTLRDERDNSPITGVSLSSVQDLQVQQGGFNAEYGNIRSGIINVVTREGDAHKYGGSFFYESSPPTDKHFGQSFNDPNSYWLRPYLDPQVAFVGTKNGGWDEATQTLYPFFEGWNAVSARRAATADPNDDLTPEAARRLFEWQHRRQLDITKNDFIFDGGFGGPVPGVGNSLGNLRFFAAFRREREMYMLPLSRDSYQENNFQLKLTSDISNTMKLTVSGSLNQVDAVSDNDVGQPGFFRSASSIARVLTRAGFTTNSRFFFDSYWALTDVDRFNISAKLTHALSPTTFYEAKIERTQADYNTRPNARRDTTKRFEIVPGFFVDEAPFGSEPNIVNGVDGMLMGVRANAFDSSKIVTTTFKVDLTSQINKTNLVKTGVEFVHNNYDMNFGAINLVLPTGRPKTRWNRSPLRAAVYLQDKLEFKGLVSNVGLRLDYIDPRGQWFTINQFNGDFFSNNFVEGSENNFDQAPVDKQLNISPRLSISHPITENSKLFFSYGHFRQMPVSDRLYNVRRVTNGSVSVIGDPNLPLQKTVAYELGFEQSLFNSYLIRVAGFNKDVTDQPNLVRIISADGKSNYRKAESNSYEDIRGVEISLNKKPGRWFGGFINYTFMVFTSGFFDAREINERSSEQRRYLVENPPRQFKPVAQPFARGNLIINTPRDFGTDIGGFRPFANWRFSFLGSWQSGLHFTFTNSTDIPGLENNFQWKDTYNIDLRVQRDFKLNPFRVQFFADVSNLFNVKIWQYLSNGPTGFLDGDDFLSYMRSLRLPENKVREFNYTPENGFGNDQPGDYRPDDVAFDPLEPNPDNDPEIARRNQSRIDKKSYIDNPNLTYLQFLNPRNVFLGIKFNFDF